MRKIVAIAAVIALMGCTQFRRTTAVDEQGCRWSLEYQWNQPIGARAEAITSRDGKQICDGAGRSTGVQG